MRVLLTFTGFHDPYTKGLVGQEEQSGPILSLVSVRAFEQIILFSTPSTVEHTQATKDALDTLHPHLHVEIRDVPLHDPTNYNAILQGVRTHLREIGDPLSGHCRDQSGSEAGHPAERISRRSLLSAECWGDPFAPLTGVTQRYPENRAARA
jgi:hypothetical protein